MIRAYRLFKQKYTLHDGQGAALEGARWNPKGTPVLYTAETVALAMLEILVHYNVLPRGFAVTEVEIPFDVVVVEDAYEPLPEGWQEQEALTQELGMRWVSEGRGAVLSVPSSVVLMERNYLINPAHADFAQVRFSAPRGFEFDPRLKA